MSHSAKYEQSSRENFSSVLEPENGESVINMNSINYTLLNKGNSMVLDQNLDLFAKIIFKQRKRKSLTEEAIKRNLKDIFMETKANPKVTLNRV